MGRGAEGDERDAAKAAACRCRSATWSDLTPGPAPNPKLLRARRLLAPLLVLLGLALPAFVLADGTGPFNDYRTLLVSRDGSRRGAPANGDASEASVSLDAKRIGFVSAAPDLSPRRSTREVFDRSVGPGRTTLVSRANGRRGAPADADATEPASSGSGRIVAFASRARNLGGRRGVENVYVRYLKKGKTILVSRASGARGARADGDSFSPSISADGTRVAFASAARNLGGGRSGRTQVYVRDLMRNRTILVSRGGGGAPGDGDSSEPAISSSGNAVAFVSEAPNLGAGGTRGQQVFARRLAGRRAVLVSRAPGAHGAIANAPAGHPSIDGHGRRVAFDSSATNLSDFARQVENVYMRDLARRTTLLVSRSGGIHGAAGDGDSSLPDLPRDGRFVCFQSVATNLGNAYDGYGVDQSVENVYVHDTLHHGTFLISRQPGRHAPGANGNSQGVSCSAGASYAAFSTVATNLSRTPSGVSEVYRRTIFGGH